MNRITLGAVALTPPSVSVVVPCYNSLKTIKRAVASVLNQTLLPTEVIIIDDCSTDGMIPDVLKTLENNAVPIKIIRNSINVGAAASRNIGLSCAQSEYIAFLDADDTWHPQKLEMQVNAFLRHPNYTLIGHKVINFKEPAKVCFNNSYTVKNISLSKLMFRNYFNTPSVMIKKFRYTFNTEYKHGEDYNLWLELAKNGCLLGYIDLPLAYVHKEFYGASGLSSSLVKMQIAEARSLMQLFFEGHASFLNVSIALVFSFSKFIRRVILTCLRNFQILPLRGNEN